MGTSVESGLKLWHIIKLHAGCRPSVKQLQLSHQSEVTSNKKKRPISCMNGMSLVLTLAEFFLIEQMTLCFF